MLKTHLKIQPKYPVFKTPICSVNGKRYRYSFNGKEKDNETYGEGNAYDFGARIYDSRLGRWLSLDPLQMKYPYLSAYNFCMNSPLYYKDKDGLSAQVTINADGSATIKMNLNLYGEATCKLTDQDIKNIAHNIEVMMIDAMTSYLAENGGKINIGGEEVTRVNFLIDATRMSATNNDAGVNEQIKNNTDVANNYINVTEGEGSSFMYNEMVKTKNEDGTTSYSFKGGNIGEFKLDEMFAKGTTTVGALLRNSTKQEMVNAGITPPAPPVVSTTPLHEIFHSFGLLGTADGGSKEGHLEALSKSEVKNDASGVFNIMLARGNGVTSYNRKPDSSTIKAMHLENVVLTKHSNETQTGSIGQITPQKQ